MIKSKKIASFVFVVLLVFGFIGVFVKSAVNVNAKSLDTTDMTKFSSFGIGKSVNVAKDKYLDYDKIGSSRYIFDSTWLNEWLNKEQSLTSHFVGAEEVVISTDSINDFNTQFKQQLDISHDESVNITDWFNVGLETSFSSSLSQEEKNYYHKYFYQYNNYKKLYNRTLKTSSGATEYQENLDQTYKGFLNLLFRGAITPQIFFDTFGTHVIIEGAYGGLETITYVILQNQYDLYKNYDQKIRDKIYGNIIDLANSSTDIGLDLKRDINVNISKKLENLYVKSVGGEPLSLTDMSNVKDSVNQWTKSLNDENSTLISFSNSGLIPLWNLLPLQYQNQQEWFKQECLKYISENSTKITDKFDESTITDMDFQCKNISIHYGDEITINDSGTKPFDKVDLNSLTNCGLSLANYFGYTKIDIILSIEMKEIEKGYQDIYLYKNELFNNESLIDSVLNNEHGGSGTPADYSYDTFEFLDIPLSEFENNIFYIAYGAHGDGKDDWIVKNVEISITYKK